MKNVKVLGTGCANCKTTLRPIGEAAREKGVAIELGKVEDLHRIVACGIMSPPGVVVDGRGVPGGGIPDRARVARRLE